MDNTVLPAIEGGKPVRDTFLTYGKQSVSQQDIDAVVNVLHSDWLTTGPSIPAFEEAIAVYTGVASAVAMSSGTAALHAAVAALGIGPGDEVIVPTITFLATANAVVYCGATPVFADVLPDTLLLDPESIRILITERTKAIIAVDYAGQCCDYDTINALAKQHGLSVIADACHSLGASYKGRNVGALAYITVFSFHPVKAITSGEGGMLTTNQKDVTEFARQFRNHGMDLDHRARAEQKQWRYGMDFLGYNYRLSDIHAMLGLSQLRRLPSHLARRIEIAEQYHNALKTSDIVKPLQTLDYNKHAYHLFVVLLDLNKLSVNRDYLLAALRAEGIGANVHYSPVHLQAYYREAFSTRTGLCPVAEAVSDQIISLPIHPAMTDLDVNDVIMALDKVINFFQLES